MRTLPLLAAYFVFTGLSLFALAFLFYREAPPMPERRRATLITAVLGVVVFAGALRWWSELHLAAKAAAPAPAPVYGTQPSIRTGAHHTDGDVVLIATHVATYEASRLCDTVRHTGDRLKPATRRAEEYQIERLKKRVVYQKSWSEGDKLPS
jgi:hypothetical protein